MAAPVGMVFRTRGFGGCARAHPLGVAPEALEEWIYSSRGFSHIVRGGFIVFAEPTSATRVAGSSAWLQEEPPSRCAEQEGNQGFPCLFCVALMHPFCLEGGVEYARLPSVGVSSDISGELLSGKSEWRPVPRSIRVG